MKSESSLIYWDTSAILSTLFQDEHSEVALKQGRSAGTHLVSSLAWAETHAVIARIERERRLAAVLVEAAREALEQGPWHRVNAVPDWNETQILARRWSLRGADLWHLAVAKNLRNDLPELRVFSFDAKLRRQRREKASRTVRAL